MSKIDQRIVEMSFENSKFERGISQSKNSLKEFSKALQDTETGKGFDGLDKSVGHLSTSFSALREIGVGALRRIGSELITLSANMVKSIAIEPITQGFSEMELKLNSTQTIMASTGETLATVNRYLQELNEYSDKTIYSFSDMTQNIGKFTNAGVKLKDAVASIKGISNAAALAGANAAEASRAMYNFAQALSAGYVKLVDWKSIELANMATVEFKNQLLEAAVAAGTVTKTTDGMYRVLTKNMQGKVMDQAISATRNFNESLSYQWMTTETLNTTLAKYADETTEIGKRATEAATQVTTFTKLLDTLKEAVGSGWAQTFEIIFGDFNEARELWTGINDALGSMIGTLADARNTFFSEGLSSGWKQFMREGIADTTTFGETLANVASEAGVKVDDLIEKTGSMEKAVKENWLTGDMLVETVSRMADSIENLSDEELDAAGYTEKTKKELLDLKEALKLGTISADEFATKMGKLSGRENIMEGLKNSLVALLSILKPISQAFDQIFPPLTANRFFTLTENFRDFTKQLIITEETANKIKRTFAGLFAVFDIGWQIVKFLGSALFTVAKVFVPFVGGITEATAGLGDFLVEINKAIKSSGFFQYSLLAIEIAAVLIRNAILSVVGVVVNFVKTLWEADDPLQVLGDFASEVFGGIVDSIKMVVDWLSNKLPKPLATIIGWFKTLGSNIATFAKSGFKSFTDLFKGFDLSSVTSGFKSFGDVIKNLDFSQITKFVVAGVLLIFIAQISKFISASTGLVKALKNIVSGFSGLFEKAKPNLLRDLAIIIGTLAASIWVLSTIPADKAKNALKTLGLALLEFIGVYAALQVINLTGGFLTKKLGLQDIKAQALNLIGVSAALGILVLALKTISKIDESTVWRSVKVLAAIGGLLAAYEVLTTLLMMLPGAGTLDLGFLSFGAGILLLVAAVKLLSGISEDEVALGVIKLAGIMALLGAAEIVFGLAARIGGSNKVSQNILSLSVGILAMLGVMKILSMVKTDTITSGLKNLALISLVLAAMEVLFGVAGRIGGGSKFKSNILSITLGMAAMLGLIAIISEMGKAGVAIDNGLIVIAKMGGIIAALELLTAASARIGGGNKTQKILLSVALTMGAFTAIIAILKNFTIEEIQQGLLTISAMVGLIGAIELITALVGKISGDAKSFGVLIGTVAAILALTISLALLSAIPAEDLRSASVSLAIAAIAISGMALSIAAVIKALSLIQAGTQKISVLKNLIPAFVTLVAIIGATVGLFVALKYIAPIIDSVDWDTLGKFATGVAGIGLLLAAFNALIKNNYAGASWSKIGKQLMNLIPAFATLAAVIAATAGLFVAISLVNDKLKQIEWSDFGKFVAGIALIGVMVTAISLLSGPLAALGAGIGPVLLGVVAAVVSVGAIVLAFVGLAELLNLFYKENSESLQNGIDLLVSVAEGIGRFIGAFIGGFAIETLTGIGEGIAGFAAALSEVKPGSFSGIGDLAAAVLAITGAAILDGISRLVNFGLSPMEQFGLQLVGLIEALKLVSVDDANGATDILAALAPMAENLEKVATAAKTIPNSGGFLGDFVGNNDIDIYGRMLQGFINALNGEGMSLHAANHAKNILAELAPIADNLKTLANSAKEIPNSGGFLGDFLGENDIDTFGLMLSGFVGYLEGLDVENDVKPASAALEAMLPMATNLKRFADVARYIPNSGGNISKFFGDNDIATFSESVAGIVSTFGDIDSTLLSTGTSNLQAMADVMLPALKNFATLAGDIGEITDNRSGFFKLFSKNTPLTDFGKDFVGFVDLLVGVDFSNVGPAVEALGQINESFAVVGAEVMANAKKSFENNKKPYIDAIIAILTEANKAVTDNKQPIIDNIEGIAKDLPGKTETYKKKFKTLGEDLLKGLKSGIESQTEKKSLLTAIADVANSVVAKAKSIFDSSSPSKVFMTIGGWCTAGLALGITSKTKLATDAATDMALDTEEAVRDALGVHSLSDIWAKIGEWLPKSLGSGMTSVKDWLLNLAKNLGIDTSKFTLDGISETLADATNSSSLTKGIEALLEQFQSTVEDADIGSKIGDNITDSMGDALGSAGTDIGNSIGDNIADGLADSLKDSKNVEKAEEAVESLLDKLQATLDERKFYGQLSLEEELEAYKAIRAEYAEGSEERKRIDREIYTLEKQIYEAQKQYIEDIAAAQKKAAEDRLALEKEYADAVAQVNADLQSKLADYQKAYNDTVADAYADAQQKRQAADQEYSNSYNDILKRAEDERIRAREDYANKQKEINQKLLSDIDAQNKAYEDAVKSRADAIYGAYGLFDEVKPDEEVTGEELLQNLRDQGAALSEWQQSLEALRARGVSEALIEELQKMGPSSKAQIKALLTLTDEQLDEYVSLFQGKYAFARTQAEAELVGLRESTNENIRQLISDAGTELADLETTFQSTMSNIDQQCSADLNELAQTYSQKLAEINSDLESKLAQAQQTLATNTQQANDEAAKKLEELKTNFDKEMTEINENLEDQLKTIKENFDETMKTVKEKSTEELEELNKVFKKKIDDINKGIDVQLDTLEDSFDTTLGNVVTNTSTQMDDLVSKVESAATGFYSAGLNAAQSFANGLRDGTWYAQLAAQALANAAIAAANQTLAIGSPSKIFRMMGQFVSAGFAKGITDYSSKAEDSTETMAQNIINAMGNALSMLESTDSEFSPVITPVIDLSVAKRQIQTANDLLGSSNSYQIAQQSAKLAASTKDRQNGSSDTSTVINNNFNLTGMQVRSDADIDDIAQKLYNKQQSAMRGRGLKAFAH